MEPRRCREPVAARQPVCAGSDQLRRSWRGCRGPRAECDDSAQGPDVGRRRQPRFGRRLAAGWLHAGWVVRRTQRQLAPALGRGSRLADEARRRAASAASARIRSRARRRRACARPRCRTATATRGSGGGSPQDGYTRRRGRSTNPTATRPSAWTRSPARRRARRPAASAASGSYQEPGASAKSLRKAPMSDGDGNRGSGGGSPQDGCTQDGSFDEPNGNSPQRLDAVPGSPTSSSSGGFGGVGSYQEPGASAKSLRKAPMSDGGRQSRFGRRLAAGWLHAGWVVRRTQRQLAPALGRGPRLADELVVGRLRRRRLVSGAGRVGEEPAQGPDVGRRRQPRLGRRLAAGRLHAGWVVRRTQRQLAAALGLLERGELRELAPGRCRRRCRRGRRRFFGRLPLGTSRSEA